jgi:hypothetical protein
VTAPITIMTNFPKAALTAFLATGTLKAMFVDAAFTPVKDTLDFANDITNEAAGTAYTAGGLAIANPVISVNTTTDIVTLDADDIVVAGLSVPARWVIPFIYTGSLATSPVLNVFDASGGVGGNVTLTGFAWDAGGIIQFQVP